MANVTQKDETSKRGTQGTIVINALKDHPNVPISLTELMEWTGLTALQVQQNINRLRDRSDVMHKVIQVLIAGHMWLWNLPKHDTLLESEPPPPALTTRPPESTLVVANDQQPVSDELDAATSAPAQPRQLPTLPSEGSSFGDGTLPLFEQVGFYQSDALLRDEQGRHWRARPITSEVQ
jgi:hypothetical protein